MEMCLHSFDRRNLCKTIFVQEPSCIRIDHGPDAPQPVFVDICDIEDRRVVAQPSAVGGLVGQVLEDHVQDLIR